jgi:hypothetical protein
VSFAGAARGIGAEPSPTITIIPVVVFVVAQLAADIAPASMRLARAAISVFFTVQNPFCESRRSDKGFSKLLAKFPCPRLQAKQKSGETVY